MLIKKESNKKIIPLFMIKAMEKKVINRIYENIEMFFLAIVLYTIVALVEL